MRAQTALIASLTAVMIMPFVGGGVALATPTDLPAAPGAGGETVIVGGYEVAGPANAKMTASLIASEVDESDCALTDYAWDNRFLNRATEGETMFVQVWGYCHEGRVSTRGYMYDGDSSRFTPPMFPGDRIKVTSEPSDDGGTKMSMHNLDEGWVVDMFSPDAPEGSTSLVVENQWNGTLPKLERGSFQRLKINGRPIGEFELDKFKRYCSTRVSPLKREGTAFSVKLVDC